MEPCRKHLYHLGRRYLDIVKVAWGVITRGQWELLWLSGHRGVIGDSAMHLRKLAQQMLDRAPDDISCDQDLVNGGDLRSRGNLWLRSSFKHSGLSKVPRESQIRLVVAKLAAKRKLGSLICIVGVIFNSTGL